MEISKNILGDWRVELLVDRIQLTQASAPQLHFVKWAGMFSKLAIQVGDGIVFEQTLHTQTCFHELQRNILRQVEVGEI